MVEFRTIPSFPDYEINQEGIVKSKKRWITFSYKGKITKSRLYSPKFQKSKTSYNGDKTYTLRKDKLTHFRFASVILAEVGWVYKGWFKMA